MIWKEKNSQMHKMYCVLHKFLTTVCMQGKDNWDKCMLSQSWKVENEMSWKDGFKKPLGLNIPPSES